MLTLQAPAKLLQNTYQLSALLWKWAEQQQITTISDIAIEKGLVHIDPMYEESVDAQTKAALLADLYAWAENL